MIKIFISLLKKFVSKDKTEDKTSKSCCMLSNDQFYRVSLFCTTEFKYIMKICAFWLVKRLFVEKLLLLNTDCQNIFDVKDRLDGCLSWPAGC